MDLSVGVLHALVAVHGATVHHSSCSRGFLFAGKVVQLLQKSALKQSEQPSLGRSEVAHGAESSLSALRAEMENSFVSRSLFGNIQVRCAEAAKLCRGRRQDGGLACRVELQRAARIFRHLQTSSAIFPSNHYGVPCQEDDIAFQPGSRCSAADSSQAPVAGTLQHASLHARPQHCCTFFKPLYAPSFFTLSAAA